METIKSRKTFLDLLRIIACFFVIVNHTNSDIFLGATPQDLTWFVSLTYFFISKIAVPIFFIISGYLLLSKIDSYKKCLQRILRIAAALVGFGLVYAVYHTYTLDPNPSFTGVAKRFLDVYITTPSNALWYLYTYLGILLMLPFLQKMVSLMTKRDYHVFFTVSVLFFSVLPILTHYNRRIAVNPNFQLPLFGGYICMLFIGQYFSKFGVKKTKSGFCIACVLFVAMVAFNVIATYFEYQKSSSGYLFFDNRTFLPILLQSVCVFYLVSFIKTPEKLAKIISYIGSCTFGIYLISDMSIGLLKPVFVWTSSYMHSFFAVIIFEICVFIVGLIAVALLKKIPFIKKVL
jgi:surface polysaccharide O-acyltransferase-like enzyme